MFKHFSRSLSLVAIITVVCGAQSLRQEAENAGLLIGTAVRPSQLSEAAYASTLAREFSMVEAEDAMKWWVLRPDRATFDFRQGDEVVRFAEAHRMKVRGHCLVWGRYNPDWLTQGHFTTRQLSRLLHEHISRVMKHYEDQVFAWDVVNEALDENGNVRDSLWYNQPGIGFSEKGTAYIEQVFRWAHEADPHALLFYNDAEGEELNRKSDAIYAMVKDFKRRGVPIDGVGLQLHIPALDADIDSIAAEVFANIARLTALGLQVHITELDVSLPLDSNGAAATDRSDSPGRNLSQHRASLLEQSGIAPRSRPGDSPTSTPGLALIRGELADRRCPSIECTSRRPPTARCWKNSPRGARPAVDP